MIDCRNTQLYIKANLIDLSDLVSLFGGLLFDLGHLGACLDKGFDSDLDQGSTIKVR